MNAKEIQFQLEAGGIEPAPREGVWLVEAAGGDVERLKMMVARRLKGQPLAYVIGTAPFWDFDWQVQEGVLIPRPDSEVLVTEVLARVTEDAKIAEVGVGSGAVIGSILRERPSVRAVATDVSEIALTVAGENLRSAGVARQVRLQKADVLENVDGPFDVVLSNPPYIDDEEWAELDASVRDFEPELALRGGADGLEIYRKLVVQAAEKLKLGGWLCVEMGWRQAAAVVGLFEAAGFRDVAVVKDLGGRDRVVCGRR